MTKCNTQELFALLGTIITILAFSNGYKTVGMLSAGYSLASFAGAINLSKEDK